MNTLPAIAAPDVIPAVQGFAQRYRRANGPVMTVINRIGGTLETQMALIPAGVRDQIEVITARALNAAFVAASAGQHAPDLGPRGQLMAVMATGAAGGIGGLPTALAELPFTITLFLHAIRQSATDAGFDPDIPAIRAACLAVFAAGSPLDGDDGLNTAFLSARLTLTGPAIQRVIAAAAPGLAMALGQKLAAQSIPILGAISGAALNAAYMNYYREMADIRFGLMALAQTHGTEPVLAAFGDAAKALPIKTA